MRRNLAFAPVVSPSPDPFSLALDAISGVISVIGVFQARKRARQAQENEVVQVQNQLAANLDPISKAAQDPNVTLDQLIQLGNNVSQLGQQFYNYTLNFSIAGPGARQTIFGDEIAPGQFMTTDQHPGWLTRLLDSIKAKIIAASGGTVTAQLGFDWESLIGIGANTAAAIGAAVTGSNTRPVYTVTGTTPTTGANSGLFGQQMPSWLLPVLVIGGLIVISRK